MKWLLVLVFLFSLAITNSSAQEMNAAVLRKVAISLVESAVPEAVPGPQATRDEVVKDTWELGVGYALVGFRSAPFNATASGFSTTLSYYFRDHVALEGSQISAWAPANSQRATAKYVFYGGGLKLSVGDRKLQPFVHGLLGGVHLFPQTQFSNNGFAVLIGGGLEKRLMQRLWFRFEGDYVRSQLYSAGQNNFQAVVGFSYRF
jgi:hypothetical protein